MAYKEKQYRNVGYNNFKLEMDELTEYRKPFTDLLMQKCHMSLDAIKKALANVKQKNIPTRKVCDQIREIIISGDYWIDG